MALQPWAIKVPQPQGWTGGDRCSLGHITVSDTAQGTQTTFVKYLLLKLLRSATGVQLTTLGTEIPGVHTQLEFHQTEDTLSLQQPKPISQDKPMLCRRESHRARRAI